MCSPFYSIGAAGHTMSASHLELRGRERSKESHPDESLSLQFRPGKTDYKPH